MAERTHSSLSRGLSHPLFCTMVRLESTSFRETEILPTFQVYSKTIQLDLTAKPEPERRRSLMDPLPGEAAPSMAPVPSVMGSASARSAARMAARAQQVDESHGNLMASILQRNRMQLARTEDEEDRKIEAVLKHMESEQEFVMEVEEFLDSGQRARERRRAELHKDWQEKVYKKSAPPHCPGVSPFCRHLLFSLACQSALHVGHRRRLISAACITLPTLCQPLPTLHSTFAENTLSMRVLG